MTRYYVIMALLMVAVTSAVGTSGGIQDQVQFPISWPPKILDNSIEMTCTDKPIQLGHTGAVQFRATCPGIWAVTHQRVDESSFRRRFFTYRHYAFKGTWDLKDQGMVESVYTPSRELFIVLPGDVIEFKSADPDPFAKVFIINLGYIKKASLPELQEWLAYNTYMEKTDLSNR
ncbi:MAG: hypothetical protein PHS86_15155 [Syntrophaceae bacterium]|nr:hypothetical protein [Syntrophaceae bacterium]